MKKYRKIIFFIIILTITAITQTSFAAQKLEEGDEMYDIVDTLVTFNNTIASKSDEEQKEALANKIKEVCGNDTKLIENLYISYYFVDGLIEWNGADKHSTHYIAAELAKKSVETGTVVNVPKEEEKKDLKEEIDEAMTKLNTMSLQELKELDVKIGQYLSTTNDNDFMLTYAKPVADKIKELDTSYKTVYDKKNEEQQEHEEIANTQQSTGTGVLGTYNSSGSHTIVEIMDEAGDFISTGKLEGNKISGSNLQTASNTLYNILLTIGIFLAVAVGMYLGIKFMMSSAEDKAKVKESLVPYIAGCVVIFGAFTIWKLAITLLSGIA